MPATLEFWDSAGSAQVTTISFSNVDPGTTSAAQQLRVVGSVATSQSPALTLRQEDGSGNAVLAGLAAINGRWIEIRALATGTSSQAATAWTPVGANRTFALDPIASGEYAVIEIRYSPAPTAAQGAIEFLVDADPGTEATALSQGISDSGRDGVLSGLGDASLSEILRVSDVEEASSPGASVDMPDSVYMHAGIPYVELAQNIAIDENDGSAAALGSGEAFWARVSLDETGWVVTRGDKASSPLDVADLPANPTGHLPVAYIERQQGNIVDSWITQEYLIGAFEPTYTSASLNLTVGPGRALVGNSLVRQTANSTVAISASSTSQVWLQSDGTFAATNDGSRPSADALLLFDGVVSDGSGIAALVDRREVMGGEPAPVRFDWSGTLADGNYAYAAAPLSRDFYVDADSASFFTIHDNGSGNSAGITKVDIQYSDAGGSYTTLFTSSGSDDRRPSIEHDDSDPSDRTALPEILLIPAGSRLRAEIDRTEAYDGTAPSGATLFLLCHMP